MSKVKRQTEKKNLSYLKQKINLFTTERTPRNQEKETNNQTENEQRTYTDSL